MNYRVYIENKPLSVMSARVSAVPFNMVWNGNQRNQEQTEEAYFVSFDIDNKPVTLKIETEQDFKDFELRPLSANLNCKRQGNTVTVTVDRPMSFTFEPDGSHNALMIFANPVSQKPQNDIIYFGKGEHKAGLIWLRSDTTIYIDEGATVYGVIYGHNVQNVKILGRGILDASPYRRGNDDHEGGREIIDGLLSRGFTAVDMKYHGNLVLNHCKNCIVEGIILRDAPMWSTIIRNDCQNITIDNIKIIGQWRYNSDGINICTSKNITVKNCFVRSFDDCIITRGAYLEGETGGCENIIVENCVLWCDWGKCLETWCGHKPTALRNITFRNNRLIHLSVAAMSMTVWYGSKSSIVENVKYESIYIDVDRDYPFIQIESEDIPRYVEKKGFVPKVVNVCVEKLGKMVDLGSQTCEEISDFSEFCVRFKNIAYNNVKYFGCNKELSVYFKEWPEIHKIENVTVQNCDFEINGDWK